MQGAQIRDPKQALTFILAGDAHVTLVSHKTGVRYTYNVVKAGPSTTATALTIHFVGLLTRPDHYEYLGFIRAGREYVYGEKSKIYSASAPALAFPWALERLVAGRVPETCEIWHEGRCGRCGRRLTVPESIETGLGPECARKAG